MKLASTIASITLLAVACSQGGITGKGAPQGILVARLDQGEGNACALPGALRNIGAFAQDKSSSPTAVADGTAGTRIACTVHDNGDKTLAVSGEMKVNDDTWFTIQGNLPTGYTRTLP